MEFLKKKNIVSLAPMAGISNPAYMKIIEEMGCDFAITELISADAIIRDNQKTFDMLKGIEEIKMPVAVQLFSSNGQTLGKAAKIISRKYPNVFIDINMGCPVPKVAIKSQAGSALLKDPDKIYEIVKEVVSSVSVPVSVKIRSGWDEKTINAPLVAKKIEEAGASFISIHGRTRKQGYTGFANWDIIKKVKEAVSIPVIGNGDIKSAYDAKKMIDETNCDGVMIGRAALGNPWIIKETVEYLNENKLPKEVTNKQKINMLKKHYEFLLKTKHEKQANLEIRSHIMWYLKGMPGASKIRSEINTSKDTETIFGIIDKYLSEIS